MSSDPLGLRSSWVAREYTHTRRMAHPTLSQAHYWNAFQKASKLSRKSAAHDNPPFVRVSRLGAVWAQGDEVMASA
jgi:hypothetical protein